MNKIKSGKLFPLFLAFSIVVIVAGVILFALLGFNTAMDRPGVSTVEVRYDVVLTIDEKEGDLENACEAAFQAQGISYLEKNDGYSVDSETLSDTSDHVMSYTFAGDVSADKLAAACEAINAAEFGTAEIRAQFHTSAQKPFGDEGWRGAIAILVGAVAAVIYLGARFGLSSAVAGFVCAADSALFTAGLFAVTRIPVFGAAPLLYAAVAAAVALLFWTIFAIRLREGAKLPGNASLSAYERTEKTMGSTKPIWIAAILIALVVVIFGGVAAAGMRAFVLPMLVSVCAALYNVYLIGPWVYAPVKRAFDRRKAMKNRGYVGGKKKTEKAETV